MEITMKKDYKCTDCGGSIEIETVNNGNEWVCDNCGLVAEMQAKVVEAQESAEELDGEVEEL